MVFPMWLPQGHSSDCSGRCASLTPAVFVSLAWPLLCPLSRTGREPLCSKPGCIDELPTCHSTRDSFRSAELQWILKMKVTSGLLWNAVEHEIRLSASVGMNRRDTLPWSEQGVVTCSGRTSSFLDPFPEHLRASFPSWSLNKKC